MNAKVKLPDYGINPAASLSGFTNPQGYKMGSNAEFENFQSGSFDDVGNGLAFSDIGTSMGAPGQGFDWGGALKNFNTGAQGLLGLAGAYSAYKQLGLMEDQFNLNKNMANRNIENQAATTNRMLDDRASMAAQMMGGGDPGTAAYEAKKKDLLTTVSGAPVG